MNVWPSIVVVGLPTGPPTLTPVPTPTPLPPPPLTPPMPKPKLLDGAEVTIGGFSMFTARTSVPSALRIRASSSRRWSVSTSKRSVSPAI